MNSNKTKKYHFYRDKFQKISMSRKRENCSQKARNFAPVSIINLNVAVPVCRQQKTQRVRKVQNLKFFASRFLTNGDSS